MKAVKFRDVLWAIEYRLGLTPTEDLFEPDAKAIASFINVAVLRYYENADFPEWTFIEPRTPVNHIVPYSATNLKDIWRVLKLFLRDPNVSIPPIDYPFRLLDSGIHVGFEHGPTVWLKYQTVPPVFTSDVWNSNKTYNQGDLVYSPVTGECYSSLVGANRGNDPSIGNTTNLFQEQVQSWRGADYGIAAQPKIMSMQIPPATSVPSVPADFYMEVLDSSGAIIGGFDYSIIPGDTLATITTALRNGLAAVPALSGFTITANTSTYTVTFQAASDFQLPGSSAFITSDGIHHPFITTQIQAYNPGSPLNLGQNQIIRVSIGTQQVLPSAEYVFSFIKSDGTKHKVSYVAGNEAASRILKGVTDSIASAVGGDAFFSGLMVSVNSNNASITFESDTPLSIGATFSPDSSSFWQLVQFPLALFNQVVRDAYGNSLRDAGQTDKAGVEEQGAIQMQGEKAANIAVQQDDILTNQVRVPSRYRAR